MTPPHGFSRRCRKKGNNMTHEQNKPKPTRKAGYAYVPVQRLGKLYKPSAALQAGTVFPELNITIEQYERGLYNGK